MRIHHFGQLVKDIDAYLANSAWERRSDVVDDPIQQSRLVLIGFPGCLESPFIELVQPLGPTSPTANALERGVSWHHICLDFDSRSDAEAFLVVSRLLPVTPWQPAALFEGRPVCFTFSRNHELIELLSHERD